jgi:hypothetical protein
MIIDLSSVLEKDDYITNYQAKSKIIMDSLKGYDNGYILIISINILNILDSFGFSTFLRVFLGFTAPGVAVLGNTVSFLPYYHFFLFEI